MTVLFAIYFLKLICSSNPSSHSDVFNILLAILVLISIGRLNFITILQGLRLYFYFSIPIFLYEAYYRFSNPLIGGRVIDSPDTVDGSSFYMYKINSLMYTNSNGVAMHLIFSIALLFSLLLFLNDRSIQGIKYFNEKYLKILIFVFFILTSMTLSRAAIAVGLVLALLYLYNRYKINRTLAIVVTPWIVVAAGFYLDSLLNIDDGSFETKFQILHNLIKYLNDASLIQILFGNNLDDPSTIYSNFVGYYGHTFYFDLIFKGGFVFALLYITSLLGPFIYSRKYYLFFFIAYILLGLSNIRIFGHYLFYFMAIYCVVFNKQESLE
ncbi:hypothetical protein ACS79_21530 [Vibrio lentus]|nr:hypothetical protein ACS79_21530 [Vibrio lentus]